MFSDLHTPSKLRIKEKCFMTPKWLPWKCKFQVIMKIVKICKEISETSSQTTQQHSISKILSQGHEVDSHALIELLISKTKNLHRCLADLDSLTFGECVLNTKGIFLQRHLLSDLLPFSRSKTLLDVFRYVGEDETIHDDDDDENELVLNNN